MSALSLVSINIEWDKHLDLVVPFLKERNPDVVCIQELLEKDIPAIKEAFGAVSYVHAPMTQKPKGIEGIGIFSRTPILASRVRHYAGVTEPIAVFDESSVETKRTTQSYRLLVVDIEHDGEPYRIGTTHFTWTPNGEADDFQRQDMKVLLAELAQEGELAFCGDFNAPRGGEIFAELAAHYKDNIPPQYETSIDGTIHRVGHLPYMVDGLFTTPSYQATDVALVPGVSDHCAIVASVKKI